MTPTKSEMRVIHAMAKRYDCVYWHVSKEDLVQEGVVALLLAATRYDSSRGVTLMSYAYPSIRKAMRVYIGIERKTEQGKQRDTLPLRRDVFLDAPINDDGDTLLGLMGAPADQEEVVASNQLQALVRTAVSRLPRAEREAVQLHSLEEIPYKEACKKVGKSHTMVQNDEREGMKRLAYRLAHLRKEIAA